MWSGTSVREIIGEGPRAEVHRFTFAPAPCRPGGVFAPLRRWREVIGDGVLTRGMGRLTPRGETFSAEGLSLRRTDLLVEVGRLEHGVGMPLEAQVLAICNRIFFGSSIPHRPTIRPGRSRLADRRRAGSITVLRIADHHTHRTVGRVDSARAPSSSTWWPTRSPSPRASTTPVAGASCRAAVLSRSPVDPGDRTNCLRRTALASEHGAPTLGERANGRGGNGAGEGIR